MIIYRVKVAVDPDVAEDWQTWMREHHVPDVIRTGFFDSAEMFQVQESQTQKGDRLNFVFDYRTSSEARLKQYAEQAAPALQKDHTDRYQGKFSASREVLNHLASFA
jgi:hypothetical protein